MLPCHSAAPDPMFAPAPAATRLGGDTSVVIHHNNHTGEAIQDIATRLFDKVMNNLIIVVTNVKVPEGVRRDLEELYHYDFSMFGYKPYAPTTH